MFAGRPGRPVVIDDQQAVVEFLPDEAADRRPEATARGRRCRRRRRVDRPPGRLRRGRPCGSDSALERVRRRRSRRRRRRDRERPRSTSWGCTSRECARRTVPVVGFARYERAYQGALSVIDVARRPDDDVFVVRLEDAALLNLSDADDTLVNPPGLRLRCVRRPPRPAGRGRPSSREGVGIDPGEAAVVVGNADDVRRLAVARKVGVGVARPGSRRPPSGGRLVTVVLELDVATVLFATVQGSLEESRSRLIPLVAGHMAKAFPCIDNV